MSATLARQHLHFLQEETEAVHASWKPGLAGPSAWWWGTVATVGLEPPARPPPYEPVSLPRTVCGIQATVPTSRVGTSRLGHLGCLFPAPIPSPLLYFLAPYQHHKQSEIQSSPLCLWKEAKPTGLWDVLSPFALTTDTDAAAASTTHISPIPKPQGTGDRLARRALQGQACVKSSSSPAVTQLQWAGATEQPLAPVSFTGCGHPGTAPACLHVTHTVPRAPAPGCNDNSLLKSQGCCPAWQTDPQGPPNQRWHYVSRGHHHHSGSQGRGS